MSSTRAGATPAHKPTQLRHPWRTTLRTAVWYAIAALTALQLGLPVIADELGAYLPPKSKEAITWFVGLIGAVLVAIQRIVLLQPVAGILSRLGLGTGQSPAPEADDQPDGDGSAPDPRLPAGN